MVQFNHDESFRFMFYSYLMGQNSKIYDILFTFQNLRFYFCLVLGPFTQRKMNETILFDFCINR